MPDLDASRPSESLLACSDCKDTGIVWLGSQLYGSPGESYAPCHCPAGEHGARELVQRRERMIEQVERANAKRVADGGAA